MDDEKLRKAIKDTADGQMPDAWSKIEGRLKNMDQKNEKKKTNFNWRRGITMGAAACAVVALGVVAVLAKPSFLTGNAAVTPPVVTQTSAVAASATIAAVQTSTPAATAAPTATVDPMQVREPVPFTGSSSLEMTKGPAMKPMIFGSLDDFAKRPEDIAQFKFIKQLDTKAGSDPNRLYTDYQMQVVKVLKGDLKPGDTVTVETFGGASDKVWIEDNFVERFTGDFDYVLFLNKTDDNGQSIYQLASSYQGYVPILDGRVSLNTKIADNGLYTQGETLDDLLSKIQDALK